jgi:NAD(P)-dependent dehydrogenase (short-subunit alcohol dehydrogenase family)
MNIDQPKTVIVTGAASGIGFACMQGLLAAGHRVCAVDLDPIPTDSITPEKRARLLTLRADVTDSASCRNVAARTMEKFGELTSLIHMAAAHSTQTWQELDSEHFNHIMAVNVTGAFLMAQAVAEQMRQHGGGAMVLASSGSINVGGVGGHGRGGPAYVSSKAAIIGLMRALARSLAPLKIRVNAVSPGSTDTAMTASYDDEARRKVAERTLVGRIGRPDEIAAVTLFLISDAASYVTGEIVNVNGGGSFGS